MTHLQAGPTIPLDSIGWRQRLLRELGRFPVVGSALPPIDANVNFRGPATALFKGGSIKNLGGCCAQAVDLLSLLPCRIPPRVLDELLSQ